MPEMTFKVQWPDGSLQDCYSPSLVMHDYLTAGENYSVPEFVNRVSQALNQASERVRIKHGFACTSAVAQREEIHDRAQAFLVNDGPSEKAAPRSVRVLAMEPQLPATDQDQRDPH